MIKEEKMPTPPKRAVGFLDHRSSLGLTIKPSLIDRRLIKGVSAKEKRKEVKRVIMYKKLGSFFIVINHALNDTFKICFWLKMNKIF